MASQVAEVLATGPAMSFQGRPRIGHLRYGVAEAGALDPVAAALANRLVGNADTETVIEVGMGGARLKMLADAWLGVAGAAGGVALARDSARLCRAGEIVDISGSPDAMWSYLAIAGGWEAGMFLGSSSRHERSDVGTRIEVGDRLDANVVPEPFPGVAGRWLREPAVVEADLAQPLPLLRGPNFQAFVKSAIEAVEMAQWQVHRLSDRVGYRLLSDAADALQHDLSLPSAPMVIGAVQVTPAGELIVSLNDGPTLGGYPVIAVVPREALPALVQRPPGSPVSLRWSG